MITIHKFAAASTVDMPRDAQILTLQEQGGLAMIWAIVDTDKPRETRTFRVVGTGEPLPRYATRHTYVGTWQQDSFVWHLFEVIL